MKAPSGRQRKDRLEEHLAALYGAERSAPLCVRLRQRLSAFSGSSVHPRPLDQTDSILITYGDQFRRRGQFPLLTLAEFASHYLGGLVSGLHILPFYPYTSDDGFSVLDYRRVDPALGNWEDIERLGRGFDLMFDAVINHVSASSPWFQAYLRGEERYADYFISLPQQTDLSQVVRPRTTPLLTRFEAFDGPRWVWTTFSDDQVDLNYQNPEVLLEVIDVLLTYVERGARYIRLDAIAYLWKEVGTPCIHLPQTHRIIQLLRAVLDEVAPYVLLITETNVPHAENLSYFGDGWNEAQMVYNFALPPLVLHAFATGRADVLSDWAAALDLPSERTTFFNFLASHDGIGLNPARGILPDAEIDRLVQRAQAHGGLISSKMNPDGSQSPYELNISYFDALSDPKAGEPLEWQARRFLAAQAILLALIGLPGIYVHSLLGSRNWTEGVQKTGRSRTINRHKFEVERLVKALNTTGSLPEIVLRGFSRLLQARSASPAFHPYGRQTVIKGGEGIFALLRTSPDGGSEALCLHNVSMIPQAMKLNLPGRSQPNGAWRDLLSGQKTYLDGLTYLEGYQVAWLVPNKEPPDRRGG